MCMFATSLIHSKLICLNFIVNASAILPFSQFLDSLFARLSDSVDNGSSDIGGYFNLDGSTIEVFYILFVEWNS